MLGNTMDFLHEQSLGANPLHKALETLCFSYQYSTMVVRQTLTLDIHDHYMVLVRGGVDLSAAPMVES